MGDRNFDACERIIWAEKSIYGKMTLPRKLMEEGENSKLCSILFSLSFNFR